MLADESAPSAAAGRGLHKDRHRPMTAESRLPSMHTQWTAGQMGRRHEAVNLVGRMQTLAVAPPKASHGQPLQQTEWICKTDTEDDVNATQTRQYESQESSRAAQGSKQNKRDNNMGKWKRHVHVTPISNKMNKIKHPPKEEKNPGPGGWPRTVWAMTIEI